MLSCQNLTLVDSKYSNKLLISGLSFSILPGGLLYLEALSEVKKSSVLEVIAGLQKPFKGQVTFNGSQLNDLVDIPIYYVGRKLGIKYELSVLENISFWADILDGQKALQASIFYLGLQDILSQKCIKLSSAILKKIAIVGLMLSKAPIWLLDDLETNLDDQTKKILKNIITAKLSSGGIVISTTNYNKNIANEHQLLSLEDYV